MKDAQKPDHISLATLIGRLRDGQYVIPDFQREFEWEPSDISSLVRSIFQDYYIGSLLLWRGKKENFAALACEPIYAYEGEHQSPQYIVLDGQQRLTAMYYAFMAPDKPAPKRANRYLYFLRVDKFMEEDYDDAFIYDWTKHGVIMASDTTRQFEEHYFPLSVVGATDWWALPNWLQGYQKHWEQRQEDLRKDGVPEEAAEAQQHAAAAGDFGQYVKDITGQYQIAYIEMDQDLELEKICDIFTQINSRGIRLDTFDLINALLRPKGLRLRHMWREASPKLNFVDTERMNVYLLQVMSILRQGYCSPKYLYYLLPGQKRKIREAAGALREEILVKTTQEFESLWDQAVESIAAAIARLRNPQEFGAISSDYLPYVSILPAFAALQTAAKALPFGSQLSADRKLRHWYWASVFLNRYSGSVESTSARDYQDVKQWFEDDAKEPPLIAEFGERFRSIDLRRELRRGTSVYNGVFNLLILSGAKDWVSGHAPHHSDLDDHHIVPKSWGHDQGLGTDIDTILNRTPLTSETNRDLIRDRLPNEYLPEMIASSGEATVRDVLETHLISPVAFDVLLRDPFTPDDFADFLTERQRSIQEAIEDLLVKARLDLPPRLREIDAEVESVELVLRRAVATALGEDPSRLPSHVQQKIGERIDAAARRNPAIEPAQSRTLLQQLEYADLRELEDTITAKTLWSVFEERFANKVQLCSRFDQLAELRNGIRHSRKVAEITLKDGEAALLWFRHALDLKP